MKRVASCFALAVFMAASLLTLGAAAQDFPNQPIKIVIPNPPAGPGDVIARHFADRATKILGQPLVFDYRPGASTRLGTEVVAKSKPDGYTILGFPSSGLTSTLLHKNVPYDLRGDFRPIIGLGSVPMALIVRSGLKLKTLDDFTAAARKTNLTYGSGGVGTLGHLSSAALLTELGTTGTHVPYRGNNHAMIDIVAGHLDFGFLSIADAMAAVGADVTVLAVTSARRSKLLEAVPTIAELGRPDFDPKLWYAFLAPKQTPADRVARLYAAFAEAAKDPTMQSQLDKLGFNIEIREPDDLSKMMDAETVRWKRVIETNQITDEG